MKNIRTIRPIGVLLAGAGAGLYPVLSCALGLGEIQVESRLNQPLRARIEIVGVAEGDDALIRARVSARAVPSDAAGNTDLLRSLRVKVEADAAHRYFLVVTSPEALTEPLFDLPVEVSEQSLQVVRSYPVLLDPAPVEEGGRSGSVVAAMTTGPELQQAPRVATENHSSPGSHTTTPGRESRAKARPELAAAPTPYTVTRSDTLRRIARRLGARTPAERGRLMRWIFEHNPEAFRGGMRHLRVGAKLTLPESVRQRAHLDVDARAAKEPVQVKSSTQEQLERELASLQQTLAKMQETISAQDTQISNLTRKIAAGSAVQRAEQPVAVQDVVSAQASEEDSEPRVPPFWLRSTIYYWIAGVGGIGLILAWVVARVRKARQVMVPRYPVPEHSSTTVRPPLAQESASGPGLSASAKAPSRDWAGSTGETLTEELPASDLQAMFQIAATAEYARPERNGSLQAQKLEMQPDGSVTNKEIIKLLEHSLDTEPHRVDLQLKLLEMYHQEALGNLENFHSLLNKVGADRRGLSPAQLLHVEMLQRTLDDSKVESAPDTRAEAAV